MEDKRTELQKKFEEKTPTIKGLRPIEYLQVFVSWLHLQIERLQEEKLPIHGVSQQRELLKAFYNWHVENRGASTVLPNEIDEFLFNYSKPKRNEQYNNNGTGHYR